MKIYLIKLLEIPRDLEKNFTNNVEPIDKNEAKTVRTKEFVNKIDSNNFEINCKEIIIRDSIRKLSNHESYYEFNNNLEINQIPDKRNNQIPRINNEYIRNELNHQMVQIPFNNIGSTAMLHSNLKLESGKFIPLFYILKKNLDFVISSENLSNKGYVRIETNSSSVIRLPENCKNVFFIINYFIMSFNNYDFIFIHLFNKTGQEIWIRKFW